MAGAWVCIATEQAPNAEGGTNPVSSNVFWLKADGVEFDTGGKPLDEDGKTVGYLGRAPHLGMSRYNPKITISGIYMRPSDLGLFMLLATGAATHTAGGAGVTDPDGAAVPTGTDRWVYSWGSGAKTATIIAKDADDRFWKATGAGLVSMPFKFDDDALSCDLEFIALYADEVTDPSLTPAFDAATPFRQGDMTIAWLSGSAVTKGFDFSIKIGVETDRGFSIVSDYPSVIQFGNNEESVPLVSGSITKRTIATADLNALKQGTQFNAVIKLTHRQMIGQTTRRAGMWIEMPGCQHVSWKPDDIKNVRRRESQWGWEARLDQNSGRFATITIVNGTTAYETYP